MPDKTLSIKIQVTADSSAGTTQAADDVKKLSDQTRHLGEEEKKTGEHAEHSGESHRALHALLRLLGQETVPELGEALHGLTLGPLGAVFALGVAASYAAKYFENLDETAKKASETFEGFADHVAKMRELNQQAAEYSAHLDNIVTKEEALAAVLKDEATYRAAIAAAQAKVDQAQTGAESSAINNEEKAGRITPEDAAAKRALAQLEESRRESDAAAAAKQKEISELQHQLDQATLNAHMLRPQVDQATESHKTDVLSRDNAASSLKTLQAAAPDLLKALNAADKAAKDPDAKQLRDLAVADGGGSPGEKLAIYMYDRRQRQLADAQAAYKTNADSQDKENAIIGREGDSGEKLKELQKSLDTNTVAMTTLAENMRSLSNNAGAENQGTGIAQGFEAVKALNDFMAQFRNSPLGKSGKNISFLDDVSHAQDLQQNGKKLTQSNKDTLRAFAELVNTQVAHNTALGAQLHKWAANQADSEARLEAIDAILSRANGGK